VKEKQTTFKMAHVGTCKFFNHNKGYGFIVDSNGQDVFVHTTNIRGNPPQEGDQLNFDYGDNNGRACALNVSGGTGQPQFSGGKGGFGFGGGKGKGKGFGKGFDGGKGGFGGGFGFDQGMGGGFGGPSYGAPGGFDQGMGGGFQGGFQPQQQFGGAPGGMY